MGFSDFQDPEAPGEYYQLVIFVAFFKGILTWPSWLNDLNFLGSHIS